MDNTKINSKPVKTYQKDQKITIRGMMISTRNKNQYEGGHSYEEKGLKRFISKCLAACLTVTIMATGGFGTMVSKAGQREDVVALARSQVGYHEKASNANLDDYTANSGSGNFTKYARDLGVGNGQPWCAYFVWWVLQSSGVDSNAYPRTGWVPTIAQWFKNAGLYYPSGGSYVPNPGDIVISEVATAM